MSEQIVALTVARKFILKPKADVCVHLMVFVDTSEPALALRFAFKELSAIEALDALGLIGTGMGDFNEL